MLFHPFLVLVYAPKAQATTHCLDTLTADPDLPLCAFSWPDHDDHSSGGHVLFQ